jgi:hypothetical protein
MSYDNLSSISQNVLKFYQQLTGEERDGQTDARTDGQTDGQTDMVKPEYPLQLRCGSIITK